VIVQPLTFLFFLILLDWLFGQLLIPPIIPHSLPFLPPSLISLLNSIPNSVHIYLWWGT
jgi:hypothetical protein